MKRSTTNQLSIYTKRAILVALSAVIAVVGLSQTNSVFADNYDAQIQQLQAEVGAYQDEASRLRQEADTLQNAVSALNAQKQAIQSQVDLSQARVDKLNADIEVNEQKLERQRKTINKTVAKIYANGSTSPIEMIAGSKNIGEYISSQAMRGSVQTQLKTAMDKVKQIKAELTRQKTDVEKVLADQTAQRNTLAQKEAEQAELLAVTRGSESTYQSIISEKNSQISGLRAEQAAANARFIGGGSYAAGTGPACGGGYPAKWCNAPMDSLVDDWGMYNRECVSYTAFKVAQSGRYMPYWGGIGNANQWDDNAWAQGIPADYSPRAGDVAISNAGYYGHAMYVESVNANGTINISQYNADWRGTYSTNTISPSGLVFIHF